MRHLNSYSLRADDEGQKGFPVICSNAEFLQSCFKRHFQGRQKEMTVNERARLVEKSEHDVKVKPDKTAASW